VPSANIWREDNSGKDECMPESPNKFIQVVHAIYRSMVSPCPSWPFVPLPQEYTLFLSVTAIVCLHPHEIWTIFCHVKQKVWRNRKIIVSGLFKDIDCKMQTWNFPNQRKGRIQFQVPDHGGTSLVQESSDQHCHRLQPVQTTIEGKIGDNFPSTSIIKDLLLCRKRVKPYTIFFI